MKTLRKTIVAASIALLVLLVLVVLLAVGLVSGFAELVSSWGGPATVHIDDETFVFGQLDFVQALVLAGALMLVLFVVAVVLPVALGLVAVLVGLALLAALGAPLLALALVAVLLASPLLLLGGLVWLIVRPRRVARPTTMPA